MQISCSCWASLGGGGWRKALGARGSWVPRRKAGYAEVRPAPGQKEQEGLDSSFLTKILLKIILHLSFLLSLFSVFQSETGRQGRNPSTVWLETQEPWSPRAWRFSLAPELCPHPSRTQVVCDTKPWRSVLGLQMHRRLMG